MDYKREHRTAPLARAMGVGRQQHGKKQLRILLADHLSSQNVYRTAHPFLQPNRGNSLCFALYVEYYEDFLLLF